MQTAEIVLHVIGDRGRRKVPLERVYRHLFNPELYLLAYSNLAKHPGTLTKGATTETIDGMSLSKIHQLIAALRVERYRWTPVRRTSIPKANGKRRPLGISIWSDKLLQEVLRLILEAYYEPQFSPHSHGFRPRRGCHTALQEVARTGTGAVWFIEGDITGCFDNIDHETLLSILSESIHDNRFLRLIRQLLQAGYLEQWTYHPTLSGTPQGSGVSPVLTNLYLDRLDQFVEQTLLPAYTQGKARRRNPAWNQLICKAKYRRQHGQYGEARAFKQAARLLPAMDTHDPHYRRLCYTRYADDFLLCFAGPKPEAEAIKEQLATFLRETLKLELSPAKTLITHAATETARFLGYEIRGQRNNTRLGCTGGRTLNGKLALRLPAEVVERKCRQYLKGDKVTHRPELAFDHDYDIVRRYQWEYVGVVNYYRLAQNLGWLARLHWVMQQSLVRTLANKYKASVGKIWAKYKGKITTPAGPRRCIQVTLPREGKAPLVATFGGISLARDTTATIRDPLPFRFGRTEIIQRLLADECEICGSREQVVVHHIRKLADLKHKGKVVPLWKQLMSARRRKTLVLCTRCHMAVHQGQPVNDVRQELPESRMLGN